MVIKNSISNFYLECYFMTWQFFEFSKKRTQSHNYTTSIADLKVVQFPQFLAYKFLKQTNFSIQFKAFVCFTFNSGFASLIFWSWIELTFQVVRQNFVWYWSLQNIVEFSVKTWSKSFILFKLTSLYILTLQEQEKFHFTSRSTLT